MSSISKVLFVAITVFLVGPQLGSIDTDGEGIPEVPIIASTAINDATSLALHRNQRSNVLSVTVSLISAVVSEDLGHIGKEIALRLRGSKLCPLAPFLRC